ncbi:MAG: MazG nucleotide pyrophosphohydrolase domain-containing protein [Brevinematia bacterium]
MEEFRKLVEIVKILRSPKGCPWDREQTLESIVENIIEEAYEVVESIHKQDFNKIKEETGDLILQGVFISQIAAETGKFTIEDVLKSLNDKLITRHPHVFNEEKLPSKTEEVLKIWENRKIEDPNPLKEVPSSFPTLLYIYKVIQKAKRKEKLNLSENEITAHIEEVLNKINLKNNETIEELLLLLIILLSMRNEREEIKIRELFKKEIQKYLTI